MIINLIKSCCRRPLKRFSFGAIDELAKHTSEFLEILSQNEPQQIEQLGMASIREDLGNFKPIKYDLKLFKPFTKLQVSYNRTQILIFSKDVPFFRF